MKAEEQQKPPRWAQRFLEWYCKPELLEDLEGDLNECFHRHSKSKGLGRAKLIYVIDVFKFFRSYTVRKPDFINLLINWIMLSSYIKTSGRSIVRNKLFSTINILGLAISMSVGLLMIAFLNDLLSYDKFHVKADRIFRVNTTVQELENSPRDFASTSVKAGKKIKESFTGVEEVVILRRGFSGDAQYQQNLVPLSGHWATESFFKVFSFPLLEGDSRTALQNPYSIVLTEKAAKKIFGNETALGKNIKFDTIEYVVTGVMKDVPKFSHIQFESLVSFSTKEILDKDNKYFLKWTNTWANYVYVLLSSGTKRESLDKNLERLCAEENALVQNTKITLWTQPLKGIAISKDLGNPIGPMMFTAVLWVLGGLSALVIICACFNYTNLSIARSLRRSREVGIRKVIGALKSHVVGQFVSEAVLIALLALVFSFVIFIFLRPGFLSIAPELSGIVSLELSARVILYFISFAIIVGMSAGFLPAIFFSRINAVTVLKDASSVKVFRNVNMRKALIVLQYTFSLIFISATLIAYKQYKYFVAFDLGFQTENILNINLQGNKPELLVKELSELPEITAISKSEMITSVGNYYGADLKYKNLQDSVSIVYNTIDENYLPLHGHKLVAGRNFTASSNHHETEVIVSEKVLKRLDIAKGNPSKALGELVTLDGKKMEIVGVMKDFHYGNAKDEIFPVVFRYSNENAGYINAKILSADLPATLASIEKAWRKIDTVHPVQAAFYTDDIQKAYSEFSAMIKIIGFLAFLAISIASMGLLGMVVFTTETRLKEISIRKVLGATEGNLIYLLSKGFIFLLAVASLAALPATYLFFDKVILSGIAYRAPIGALEMISGVTLVMTIAFIMIGFQTLKVSRSNPAEVLKGE